MYYAQFYCKSAISENLVEACGDRSVIILDGRENISSHRGIAMVECRIRHYAAYSLHKGEAFSRATLIEGPHLVPKLTPRD